MRVCIVHNIMWSHYKAVVFSELYKLTQKDEVELLVIQIAPTQQQRKNLGEIDWSLHKYPYKLLFDSSFEEIPAIKMANKLIKEVRQFDPDIVLTPGIEQPAYWPLMLLTKMLGKKLATTYDSTELDHKRVWYKERYKSLLFSLEDLVFCYGTAQQNYLRKLNVPDRKIKIRVQATDNQKIREGYLKNKGNNGLQGKYDYPSNCFLFVGRLSKEKNLLALIQAFHACNSNWGLIFVGSGPQEQELKKFVQRNNVANVFFTGGKPWDEVSKYYTYAKVFVLPSTSEPWGLVINEAMLCNMPVLVSNHCGCALDLVENGKNGFTFDPYNVGALSQIMQLFITAEVNIFQMGEQSFKIIQRYTPQRAAAQMLEGINTLLKNQSSH